MTNAELLSLLREAQEALYADHGLMRDSFKCDCRTCSLRKAIDAALAAHEAEAPDSATPVVEWKERQGCYIHDDGVNELRVYLWGGEWHWKTVVEYRADGTRATEAEAKTAAIAAARGMR